MTEQEIRQLRDRWDKAYDMLGDVRRAANAETPPEVLAPQLDDAARKTIGQIQMMLSRSIR